jgi:hypothetical protein
MLARWQKNFFELHDDRAVLVRSVPSDAFYLFLTLLAQSVETHVIAVVFLDVVVQAMAEREVLAAREVALEYAVLDPLAEAFQGTMNTSAPFVVFDVV